MKQGTIFIATGKLYRKGRRTIECRECGRHYSREFCETLRINQRVIAAHAEEARYLIQDQYDVNVQSGVDHWLEPLTIEPLPVDQVLRELGAPELIKGPRGWGGLHLRLQDQ